jgi:glucosyltransferase
MPLVSLVVPSYNEQEVLGLFYDEACKAIADVPSAQFEFIFVDDGSTDATLAEIQRLRASDPRVRYVSFSRNFGKEAAMLAGMQRARGDYVALLDADLQDPPSLLPEMYRIVTEEGFDCVATRRSTRDGESRMRSFFSANFYRVFNRVSRTQLVSGARDFRLMNRQMVDAILELCESNRFSKGLFSWVGFNTHWIEYENVERAAGTTKWSLLGLVRYSIEGIVNFSTAPLAIASALGFAFCLAAIVWIVAIIIRTTVYGNAVPGWSSLACIVLFSSGMQFLTTGILGQYIARMYVETKHRPIYVVRETEE